MAIACHTAIESVECTLMAEIDLYHTAAILSPRRTKSFCPSSLTLDERLHGQNLLFQHNLIKLNRKKFYRISFEY